MGIRNDDLDDYVQETLLSSIQQRRGAAKYAVNFAIQQAVNFKRRLKKYARERTQDPQIIEQDAAAIEYKDPQETVDEILSAIEANGNSITPREYQTLKLLALGFTNLEISKIVNLSRQRICKIRQNIHRKTKEKVKKS